MSVIRERERTTRTVWIVAGLMLAVAIVFSAYLFARRTDIGAAAPVAAATDGGAESASKAAAAPLAIQPAVRESAPPAPVASTQVAVAASPQPVETADTADTTSGDASDASAPKLSAEEQSLADSVGDTRRAAPVVTAAAAATAAATVTAAAPAPN